MSAIPDPATVEHGNGVAARKPVTQEIRSRLFCENRRCLIFGNRL
jgi:hypothetical protein